jgi:hypothetical protein
MELPKGIYLLEMTEEKITKLWQELDDFCRYLGSGDFRDSKIFLQEFLAKDSVILEASYGYFMAKGIRKGERAEVHLPLLDHKLSAHTEDVLGTVRWLFVQYGLIRVETLIYDFQNSVRRFLKDKLGFTHEGTLRKRTFLRGEWRDVEVYSILREEALDG